MQCNVRPLNKGECFCCSIKKAKKIFKDTDVYLNFSYLGRSYVTFAETADGYYLKRNVKGQIIASMLIRVKDNNPIMSFYVLKAGIFPDNLREEFESDYLQEFHKTYQEQMLANSLVPNPILLLVELMAGKLKMHKVSIAC